jgi:membrane protease YdiL (CAAX protease family)
MKQIKNNRVLWTTSFILIILFWILLGSSLINIYAKLLYRINGNNAFMKGELYQYIGANIPFISIWLGFYFCFKYINNIKLSKLINNKGTFDFQLFKKIFIFSICFFTVVITMGYFLKFYDLEFIKNNNIQRLILIPFTLILTPLQVIAEEILFRAILLKIFIKDYERFKNQKNALLYSIGISVVIGIIFVLPHLFNPEVDAYFISAIAYYFIFGSLATFSILVTGGLEISIAIHLANNFIITFFSTYENSALASIPLFIQTNEIPFTKYFETIALIVLFLIIGYKLRDRISNYLYYKSNTNSK